MSSNKKSKLLSPTLPDTNEHGHDLHPSNFRNLDPAAQQELATMLMGQSSYLRSMPHLNSSTSLVSFVDDNLPPSKDFTFSLSFSPDFICRLCINGFLPMAGQIFADLICLLPKLHTKRCIMRLSEFTKLSIPKKLVSKATPYTITVSKAFNTVIEKVSESA